MIEIRDNTGTVIGRIEAILLVESRPDGTRSYTDAYAADVLGRLGNWLSPGGRRHYATEEGAREAILADRASQTAPVIPKGLRLGRNQKWALWNALASPDRSVEPYHAPALAKKGLASESGWGHYTLTDLGQQIAEALFTPDGQLR